MKNVLFVSALALSAATALPQSPNDASAWATNAPYVAVERGPHWTVWQAPTNQDSSPEGSSGVHLRGRYVEIATGLNHLDPIAGQYVPSSDQIIPTPTGAAGSNAQTVTFLGNINSAGAVTFVTPDGKTLTSSVLGLSYYDSASGQSVMFAEVQDSTGQILPSGCEAIYTNAIGGAGIQADIMYQFSQASFEQFVVLRTQLPSPANWNLDPATTLLQVITEFENPPSPAITPIETDAGPDELLDFGVMKMAKGSAFALGSEANKIPVSKQWLQLEGRTVLVEQVPLESLAPQLQNLPAWSPPGSASLFPNPNPNLNLNPNPASSPGRAGTPLPAASRLALRLPPPKPARTNTPSLKLAQAPVRGPGLVLDYTTLSSQTNLDLQKDTTYYVSGLVNVYGTLTCEGGVVVKYATSPTATLVTTNLALPTAPYEPAVFTSKDDNVYGVSISGSSGSPSGYYGGVALDLSGTTSAATISNVRFSYISNALACVSGSTIRDAQFSLCKSIVNNSSGTFTLENVLGWQLGGFQDVGCSSCGGVTLTALNSTFDVCSNFLTNAASSSVYLTNCILALVTNWQAGTFATNSCAVLSGDTGIFQTVGAGSHYLASGSPYRNAGTTNIDPVLLTNLAARTTYPPVVYSNATFSIATTFNPQAARDGAIGAPDLGYAYDAIDWAFGGCTANANLSFTPGTAACWFEPSGSSYGIGLENNVTNTFTGTATAPCWWVRYCTVQEGVTNLWKNKGVLGGIVSINSTSGDPPEVSATFLHCSLLANDASDFRDDVNPMSVVANNCEFSAANVGGYGIFLYCTNCLFDRKYVAANCCSTAAVSIRNCTFHGCNFDITRSTDWPAWVENCAFDYTLISMDNPVSGNTNVTYCDFNAFETNGNLTSVLGPHCLTNLLSFNWQSGPLGNYYQPSNSPTINTGSVPASVVGLYHFTVMTNLVSGLEVPEGTNIVSIGYHFVATDAYGNPIDTNGDGIPDYLEDLNGNGLVDSGEIGWNITGDPGLTILITRPKNNSVIP